MTSNRIFLELLGLFMGSSAHSCISSVKNQYLYLHLHSKVIAYSHVTHVIPDLYDWLSSAEHKRTCLSVFCFVLFCFFCFVLLLFLVLLRFINICCFVLQKLFFKISSFVLHRRKLYRLNDVFRWNLTVYKLYCKKSDCFSCSHWRSHIVL